MKNKQDQDDYVRQKTKGEDSSDEDAEQSQCCKPGNVATVSMMLNLALFAFLIALFSQIDAMQDVIDVQSQTLSAYSARIEVVEAADQNIKE